MPIVLIKLQVKPQVFPQSCTLNWGLTKTSKIRKIDTIIGFRGGQNRILIKPIHFEKAQDLVQDLFMWNSCFNCVKEMVFKWFLNG